jgi:peptide/nickel transport system substrate-binding protein
MKRLFYPLAIILILSLLLIGCSSSPTSPASTAKPAASTPPNTPTTSAPPKTSASSTVTPQSGGTLKIHLKGVLDEIGVPWKWGGFDTGLSVSSCLETLFRIDPQGNFVPLLAKEWKADTSARTLTITLQKGIKFQDGTDFNAAAVKWNMDQYKSSPKASHLGSVSSIDVVDEYTVRLNLSQFDNNLMLNLARDAGRMISPTAYKTNGDDWAQKNPVGTGPFSFVSWQKDVSLKFKRFDGYWGGKPYLDEISLIWYADSTAALLGFKAGNLDILQPDPNVAKDLQDSGQYVVDTRTDSPWYGLNLDTLKDPKSPFTDIKVRQAIAYAFDTKTLANSLGYGYYMPTNQFAVPGSAYFNPNIVGYPYNVQKAKDLLTQAGFPNGFKTTLSYYASSQGATDEITVYLNYLKAVGIDATPVAMQRPGYNDVAGLNKGFNGMLQFFVGAADPFSSLTDLAQGRVFGGFYRPDEYVNAFNQALAEPDPAKMKQLVWQANSLAVDKYCMLTNLYIKATPIAKSKKVHDDGYGPNYFLYLNPMTWLSK